MKDLGFYLQAWILMTYYPKIWREEHNFALVDTERGDKLVSEAIWKHGLTKLADAHQSWERGWAENGTPG